MAQTATNGDGRQAVPTRRAAIGAALSAMRRSSRRLSIGTGAAVAASIVVADAWWSDLSPIRIVLYGLAAGASTLLIAGMVVEIGWELLENSS